MRVTKGKSYLVIGLGRFGRQLALRLAAMGASVVAMDKVKTRVQDLSDKLEYVVWADATDEAALEKIGAKDVDVAVVCLGEDSERSILVTAILKDLAVPYVVARANNELQAKILEKIGADRVISPEADMGLRFADALLHPWMSDIAFSDNKDFGFSIVDAPETLRGQPLSALSLPSKYRLMVVLIEREGQKNFPAADTIINSGDKLWLFGDKLKLTELLENSDLAH